MDTKLKRTHKLAVLLIALSILLPATILVALYPRMEQVYKQQLNAVAEENTDTDSIEAWLDDYTEIVPNYVNYVVEASYYIYGQMIQDDKQEEVDFVVLDEYGWIDDYYSITEDSDYYAQYQGEKSSGGSSYSTNNMLTSGGSTNSEYNLLTLLRDEKNLPSKELVVRELQEDGYLGYVVLKFDAYGKIANVYFQEIESPSGEKTFYYSNLYDVARQSVKQYESNVYYFNEHYGEDLDAAELQPKNFEIVFAIPQDSGFVYQYVTDTYFSPTQAYFDMGAIWIVVIAVLFVMLVAFVLPFFKKLETGYEKLFSLPVEVIWCIAGITSGGIIIMFETMCFSSYTVLKELIVNNGGLRIIGYDITPEMMYYFMLVVNYIGWAICFFGVYIVTAATRQFLCAPIRYTKEKWLFARFLRWVKRGCVKLYHYVTDIEIGSGMKKSIVKLVLANGAIVLCLCCFWFAGFFGVIVYSVLLYLLLLKYGSNMQKQYESIVYATKQMAEGNLKGEIEEELGIFTELGTELKQVQEGFSKAVAEEAKSQNMKTELITNVSHDLKTPLTAIITYVDLLKKENISEEERKEYVDTLDKKSQRLKVLIEDLFEVSKATTNNITMYRTDMDLVNLLKQVYLENEDKIAESSLDIRLTLPEKKCVAYLDPNRTYRIIDNLLQNALKYSMPHSRVYMEMEEVETEYVIRFKNMSATEMNFDASEITERFVRGDLSRNTEGSGLGLAIAQSFTELQDGKFQVEIDGDLFKVTLRFNKKSME